MDNNLELVGDGSGGKVKKSDKRSESSKLNIQKALDAKKLQFQEKQQLDNEDEEVILTIEPKKKKIKKNTSKDQQDERAEKKKELLINMTNLLEDINKKIDQLTIKEKKHKLKDNTKLPNSNTKDYFGF